MKFVTHTLSMLAAIAGVTAFAPQAHADPKVIKIATLAPEKSPWGTVFKVWQAGVAKRSNSQLVLDIAYGTQGDENAIAAKIRGGQLDGAALTAAGLAQFNRDVLALQLPGVFGDDWKKLDAAREKVRPQLEAGFSAQKVTILGWGDVGIAHFMSKGRAVQSPDDLKNGFKPYALPGDPVGRAFLTKLGVSVITVQVPEILPGITSGRIDVINAPALAAEQLQWGGHVDYINSLPSGIGIGALIMSSEKLNALTEEQRTILKETGAIAGQLLTKKIRDEDAAAFGRLKGKLKVYDPTAADKEAWAKLAAAVRGEVCGPSISKAMCDAVIAAAK